MADKWSTPKSSLPPYLRPSSRVTPTLALSEGPLTPSPNTKLNRYNEEDAPIFCMNLDSPIDSSTTNKPLHEGKGNSEEPNVDMIKLQCQMEQLTRK